jgi:hypothetical protein
MISAGSGAKGKARLSVGNLDMDGRATFDVDGLMLRQFFDAAGDRPVTLRVFGPKDPILFHAGPDYDFVIMPLTKEDKPRPAPAEPGPEPVDGPGPEPVAPAAETPDAHRGNGRAE